MIKASDLKTGTIVDIQGDPHILAHLQIQSPSARGGASLYKCRFRNLRTRQKVDQTLKGEDSFKEVDFEKREVQFLYREQDSYAFMDLEDYNQFSLFENELNDVGQYLVEDMEGIIALVVDGKPVAVEMPAVVDLKIQECGPSIKGASATSRTKPATLETGLIVQVPEYMSQDETIRVDTRTAKYVSRA